MSTERLDALRALAAGVAVDRSLEVVEGPPGCGWSIDTHTGRIQVDPRDLQTLPDTEIHGLVCHEAAHAAMTRYPWLVPRSVLEAPGVRTLLNSVEDCRIESWLVQRLPGATPWVEAYNDRLFPTDGGSLPKQPLFVQFSVGLIHEWWHGERPPGLDERVSTALQRTAEARREAVGLLPPIHAETPRSDRYEGSRVARVFAKHDGLARPDGFEVAVRLSAAEAWAVIWEQILPIYRDLVALDPPEKVKQAEQAFLARVGAWTTGVRLKRPVRPSAQGASVELPAIDASALARALDPPSRDTWDAARRDVLPLVDALVDQLLRALRPRSLPRWVEGHTTGQRLDLRHAMRFEARPERLDLWQRKTVPEKSDPRFLLLLDLSGSMAGDRIHWGFRGTVLLAEVLARLDLPFAVYGFQDRLIAFKPFDQPLEVATPALSTMPLEVSGSRPGGHNRPEHNWDGPVLEAACEELMGSRSRSPVLIVVSDGLPSGPANAEAALRRAVSAVSRRANLVGLGLGPGTGHVRSFYDNAVADVPLAGFPAAIGRCIHTALGVG
ncbi:MAG: hypothetical protein H6737_28960 [Alphaproteobacteria bacterium]|nr:hypothetical protein [Alphaproteobacteria bacterium]